MIISRHQFMLFIIISIIKFNCHIIMFVMIFIVIKYIFIVTRMLNLFIFIQISFNFQLK